MVNTASDSSNPSRARILEAARTEFAEKGFDGARVDSIAQRAEVNKALIYYYFRSKGELLQELLRDFLEERRLNRPTDLADSNHRDLPSRIAEFDVSFLFEKRDILRIALMEDLKSSKDGIPGPGTVLRHWLDGLVEAREAYNKAGYGFRYTPRVVVAMYFFHLMPIMSFCAMGETLAKTTGLEPSTVREEFLRLILEQNSHHFHSVFGDSCTDPTPEVSLPGLERRPPSDMLAHVRKTFREGASYEAREIETLLAAIVAEPGELFARLLSLGHFRLEPGGSFRWCLPATGHTAPIKQERQGKPQAHMTISPEERAKLVAKHMPHGRLENFPLKEKARLAIIEHIAESFAADTTYTEREVDAILKPLVADHSKARRYLVDYGYLRRTPDGSRYWTWEGTPS